MKKCLMIFLASIIPLCAVAQKNPPLFIMYSGMDIIKEQSRIATIIVPYFGVDIDGMRPSEETHYKLSGNLKDDFRAFDVLPGLHTLKLRFTPRSTITNYQHSSYRTTYAPQDISTRYNFEAGKIYWVAIDITKTPYIININEGRPPSDMPHYPKKLNPDKLIEKVNKARLK